MDSTLSLAEFLKQFPDDNVAEAWFIRQRWPEGMTCPRCESHNIAPRPSRRPMPYRCRARRKNFSVKTDSIMQGWTIEVPDVLAW